MQKDWYKGILLTYTYFVSMRKKIIEDTWVFRCLSNSKLLTSLFFASCRDSSRPPNWSILRKKQERWLAVITKNHQFLVTYWKVNGCHDGKLPILGNIQESNWLSLPRITSTHRWQWAPTRPAEAANLCEFKLCRASEGDAAESCNTWS